MDFKSVNMKKRKRVILENPADLHQIVTFRIKDHLKFVNPKISFLLMI